MMNKSSFSQAPNNVAVLFYCLFKTKQYTHQETFFITMETTQPAISKQSIEACLEDFLKVRLWIQTTSSEDDTTENLHKTLAYLGFNLLRSTQELITGRKNLTQGQLSNLIRKTILTLCPREDTEETWNEVQKSRFENQYMNLKRITKESLFKYLFELNQSGISVEIQGPQRGIIGSASSHEYTRSQNLEVFVSGFSYFLANIESLRSIKEDWNKRKSNNTLSEIKIYKARAYYFLQGIQQMVTRMTSVQSTVFKPLVSHTFTVFKTPRELKEKWFQPVMIYSGSKGGSTAEAPIFSFFE